MTSRYSAVAGEESDDEDADDNNNYGKFESWLGSCCLCMMKIMQATDDDK